MNEIRLENWSIIIHPHYNVSGFESPEILREVSCLHGNCYGHPKHDDGKNLTTSPISHKDGDIFVTCSGSRYVLGEVDPEYQKLNQVEVNKILSK